MNFLLKLYRNIRNRFSIAGELIEFFWAQKLWWLIPFIVILLVFALLLIFAQSTPLAPFIYTAF